MLSAAQHGVVARRQLEVAGVTPSMIRTRMANGALIQLHRGVYAVGHAQLRREGRWLAAVLAAGPGAVLSHRDAAGLHGIRPANHVRVDVTTPRRLRQRPGIALHHSTTVADDVTIANRIPVTTLARTLVDLAAVVPADHLAKAMREADRQGKLDLRAVEAVMERTRNRPGKRHAALRSALADHRRRGTQLTRSPLEDRFLGLLDAHGLPRPETNVVIEGMEVDALWRSRRIVVELDGWAHHNDRLAFERDRERSNELAEAGYTVLRFTHDAVAHRPSAVANQLARVLAA